MGRFFLERQFDLVLAALEGLPGVRTILDVGGGHDQVASRLAAGGYEVTVLGSGPDCFRTGVDTTHHPSRVVGSLLDLPVDDGAFDVTLSLRSLPHVARWERLIDELCRVARRAVIVDYPAWRSVNVLSPLLFPVKRLIEGDTRRFTVFSSRQIRRAFDRAGFLVDAARPEFLVPMGVHRLHRWGGLARSVERVAGASGLTRAFGSPIIATAIPAEPAASTIARAPNRGRPVRMLRRGTVEGGRPQ